MLIRYPIVCRANGSLLMTRPREISIGIDPIEKETNGSNGNN
jgi:hypothetical protein